MSPQHVVDESGPNVAGSNTAAAEARLPESVTDLNLPASTSDTRHESTSDTRHESQHNNFFNVAHGRNGKDYKFEPLTPQEPIRLRHIFKPPFIRQWLYQGKFYREDGRRVCSRYELFFDLVFVGLIQELADGVNIAHVGLIPAGVVILRFYLLFYLSFSVWQDVRHWINQSGTDDVIQRLYFLLVMGLLVGFYANATHVGIVAKDKDGYDEDDLQVLVPERRIGDTQYFFVQGYHAAITDAFGFYLTCKLSKVALLLAYGLLLPNFRKALWLETIPVILLVAIYIPLTVVRDPITIVTILASGIGFDILSKYIISAVMQHLHGRNKRQGQSTYIPAHSVDHLAERTLQFAVLVLGELVLASTFQIPLGFGHGSPSPHWARSVLSLAGVFALVWIYFDADSSRVFAHALRRNPFTAITFNLVHFPLYASSILVSTVLPQLAQGSDFSPDLWHWCSRIYGGSMAMVMACIAVMGLLHKNLDMAGNVLWPRSARIGLRFAVALSFAALPLADWRDSMSFLGCYCGLLFLVVVSETVGKLGVVGRRYDELKTKDHQRLLQSSNTLPSDNDHMNGDAWRVDIESQDEPHDMARRPQPVNVGNGGRQTSMQDSSAADPLESTHRTICGFKLGFKLKRKRSWHSYDDLTADERGDEDLGVVCEMGNMEECKHLTTAQRWALVAG